MTAGAGARVAVLAAVALVAAAISLVVVNRTGHHGSSTAAQGAGQWYTALAAPYAPRTTGKSPCGVKIGPATVGIAHPVLPCGVKLFVEYGGRTVLTQVIDRGPAVPGREFDITRALAQRLRLQGTQTIRWRFAR